jgi:hypothetical protein
VIDRGVDFGKSPKTFNLLIDNNHTIHGLIAFDTKIEHILKLIHVLNTIIQKEPIETKRPNSRKDRFSKFFEGQELHNPFSIRL